MSNKYKILLITLISCLLMFPCLAAYSAYFTGEIKGYKTIYRKITEISITFP